jgi:hypothetical protein
VDRDVNNVVFCHIESPRFENNRRLNFMKGVSLGNGKLEHIENICRKQGYGSSKPWGAWKVSYPFKRRLKPDGPQSAPYKKLA